MKNVTKMVKQIKQPKNDITRNKFLVLQIYSQNKVQKLTYTVIKTRHLLPIYAFHLSLLEIRRKLQKASGCIYRSCEYVAWRIVS